MIQFFLLKYGGFVSSLEAGLRIAVDASRGTGVGGRVACRFSSGEHGNAILPSTPSATSA
jgi:hypothetical protein